MIEIGGKTQNEPMGFVKSVIMIAPHEDNCLMHIATKGGKHFRGGLGRQSGRELRCIPHRVAGFFESDSR